MAGESVAIDLTGGNKQAQNPFGLANVPDADEPNPAAGADAQKPDTRPAGADDQKPESSNAEQETPEQQEQRQQSRRQRAWQRQHDARIRAEAEAALLRRQLDEERSQRTQQQDSGEPKRENFDSYEAYLEARVDWRADQKAKATEAPRTTTPQQGTEQQRQPGADPAGQKWLEREKAFEKTAKDYEPTVLAYLEEDIGALSPRARQDIIESEYGPQLLYHLAKNPAVHERISELSPARQTAELVKLADELSKPPAKKQTGAPPAPTPVSGGRSAGNGYSANMTDAEYAAMRKSQGATWAR